MGNILLRHDLPPAPLRKNGMPWKEFIRSHLDVLAATDFFSAEVLTLGLVALAVVVQLRRERPTPALPPPARPAIEEQSVEEITAPPSPAFLEVDAIRPVPDRVPELLPLILADKAVDLWGGILLGEGCKEKDDHERYTSSYPMIRPKPDRLVSASLLWRLYPWEGLSGWNQPPGNPSTESPGPASPFGPQLPPSPPDS